ALEDLLDGAREEVLAVDAKPFDVAPGEVDEAVGVAVAEVAGVVAAAARARRRGLVVLPVALEEAGRLDVHDLADRRLGVREPARVVEARDVALAAVLAQDLHARAGAAERARGIVVAPRDRHADLARAVAVDDLAAEAARERVEILARSLVAVREPERV